MSTKEDLNFKCFTLEGFRDSLDNIGGWIWAFFEHRSTREKFLMWCLVAILCLAAATAVKASPGVADPGLQELLDAHQAASGKGFVEANSPTEDSPLQFLPPAQCQKNKKGTACKFQIERTPMDISSKETLFALKFKENGNGLRHPGLLSRANPSH